jgi:hypothetical protein
VRTSPSSPLVGWRRTSDALPDLAHVTLKRGGLRDTLFVSASGDGSVVAAMLDSETPGVVVVMREKDAAWRLEQREGNLLLGTSPMIGNSTDGSETVEISELTRGVIYLAPLRVTAADAGITAGQASQSRCCGWWEHTLWRAASQHPERGLVRATVAPLGTWSVLDFYEPGREPPRWRVAVRSGEQPSTVADVALSPQGERVFVQFTDGGESAQLVAFDSGSGAELWRARTGATVRYAGALVVSHNGSQVVTIVSNPGRCETCEKIEIHDAATGRMVREVPLDGADLLSRRGTRGSEKILGISDDRLWFRGIARSGGADSMKARACTYESWSLSDGRRQAVEAEARSLLADCDAPLWLVPVDGGVMGVRASGSERAQLVRFQRAP